jgi:hypothetical protein
MSVFSFVLVPLAIVVAWALIQDRRRRHRPRRRGADMESRIGLPGRPRKSGDTPVAAVGNGAGSRSSRTGPWRDFMTHARPGHGASLDRTTPGGSQAAARVMSAVWARRPRHAPHHRRPAGRPCTGSDAGSPHQTRARFTIQQPPLFRGLRSTINPMPAAQARI